MESVLCNYSDDDDDNDDDNDDVTVDDTYKKYN